MSKRIKTKDDLKTQAEKLALCDAASLAWKRAPGNAYSAIFTWRGQRFCASHTSFRLLVETMDGQPLVSRYD